MFAACTGLAYHFSASFRLESYFGAFFPLPTVLAAARWRGAVAWKTMACQTQRARSKWADTLCRWPPVCFSCSWAALCEQQCTSCCTVRPGRPRLLLLVLVHVTGSLGVALGLLWRQKCSWLISIPCTALVRFSLVLECAPAERRRFQIRCAGVFGSLAVSSLLLRENVLALVAAQMFALLDQMSAAVGLTTTPEFHWVYFLAATLVLVNSVSYVTLLHLLYALVLGRIGGGFGNAPAFVRRAFLQP